MQNVEWVMEWVIPLRLLPLLEHLAVLKNDFQNAAVTLKKKMKMKSGCIVCSIDNQNMHHQWTWRESFLLLTNPVSQQWLPLYQNYIKLVTFSLHRFHHAAMVLASLNTWTAQITLTWQENVGRPVVRTIIAGLSIQWVWWQSLSHKSLVYNT